MNAMLGWTEVKKDNDVRSRNSRYSMRKKKFCIKKSMICEQGSVSDKDYKGTSLVSTYTALLPKMGSQFESLESL